MDIEIIEIDGDRKAAVSIVGVELISKGAKGKVPQICYALRLISGEYELGARKLASADVEKWLGEGLHLVREAFEWTKTQDGVADKFMSFAAEYERAYEYGQKKASALAKGNRL